MKKFISILSSLALVGITGLPAQVYPLPGQRRTHKGAIVKVKREPNPPSNRDMRLLQIDERVNLSVFNEASLIVSVSQFQFTRNCHDYAFSPYMTCMCNPSPPGDQKECWWMQDDVGVDDVRRNWTDGPPSSMTNVVTSLPRTGSEFLFNTADFAGVVGAYQNDLDGPFPLVVCPLNSVSQLPVHAALLVSLTPMSSDTTRCYGLYESKWGYLGIFRHRWGTTYSNPNYNVFANTLRVFAPNPNAWGNPGAYPIYWPDPFGPSD